MAKRLSIDDLNRIYSESEQVDQELYAEQRSNVLLAIGEHFSRRNSKFHYRIRDSKSLSEEQKIRLTKNHIQKITKTIINGVISHAPSVGIVPKNESELQDQKCAELHQSVWQDIRHRHLLRKRTHEWCKDFVEIGECFVKITWDPNKGLVKGYEQELNDQGQPVFDEQGQPVSTQNAIFSGDFVFERIWGFDIGRAPEAKSMDESRYLTYRKLVEIEDLKAMVGNDPEKVKFIQESQDETYVVFDGSQGFNRNSKNQCMVREYYFRPCAEYPQGYYYIATSSGVLFEGELPLGLFPICYVGFDEASTSPRSRSIIKQLRPYNAEINRCASAIAETQVTLGQDKLLIQDGTKISHGGQVPGIRAVKYTGMAPVVLPGRSGDQYLTYLNQQITEMYQIANVPEDAEEMDGQADAYAMLFKSLRNKKKFTIYAEKFEQFLIEICEKTLRLAKEYLPDDALIPAIGKREMVNIPEFRSMDDLGFQIKIEPQTDDVETKMGKQISITNALQYIGNQLSKDDIGKMLRAMPFVNEELAFNDLTIDFDNANNDILALDRGEYPAANPYDNHEYMVKRLTHRMKQADYKFLHPAIQQNYQRKKLEHEQIAEQQLEKIAAMKSQWIPTSGYMVVCDLYVSDPQNPTKTRRARIPYDALAWLIKKLELQGTALEQLEKQNPQTQAELADMTVGSQGAGVQQPSSPYSVSPTDMLEQMGA